MTLEPQKSLIQEVSALDDSLTRSDMDRLTGPAMIEFGASWCGYCQAAQPAIAAALTEHASVRHIRIEDGKGKRLGRSYGVKLWPTLIFLRDGMEVERLVRPADANVIAQALRKLCAG